MRVRKKWPFVAVTLALLVLLVLLSGVLPIRFPFFGVRMETSTVTQLDIDPYYPIAEAIAGCDDSAEVIALIESTPGVTFESRSGLGFSALQIAVFHDRLDVAGALIDAYGLEYLPESEISSMDVYLGRNHNVSIHDLGSP